MYRCRMLPVTHSATSDRAKAVIGVVERTVHYFVLDLPHSDGCFVKAYSAETTEAFCDGCQGRGARPLDTMGGHDDAMPSPCTCMYAALFADHPLRRIARDGNASVAVVNHRRRFFSMMLCRQDDNAYTCDRCHRCIVHFGQVP